MKHQVPIKITNNFKFNVILVVKLIKQKRRLKNIDKIINYLKYASKSIEWKKYASPLP